MGHLQHATFGDHTQQWRKSDKTGNLFNTEDKQDSAARTKSTSWHSGVCESFVPCGKITNGKHYSIITDHLGTPIEAYNQEGALIWEREQDLYGNSRQGFAKENFRCPFKYQGQYYDSEVELCYNRFRYYHPETGRYISEDPIGFLSGEPNFFAYVSDTNAWVDLLGLDSKHNHRNIKDVDAMDDIDKFLGNGEKTNIHPRKKTEDKDRIFAQQPDGT